MTRIDASIVESVFSLLQIPQYVAGQANTALPTHMFQ